MNRRKPLRKKARKKSLSSYKNKLWGIFSQYIRRRNADAEGAVACFTCGRWDHYKNMDAGHYIARSLGLATYFHEQSVQVQCTACNRFRHGNLTQFAIKLREKYGDGILEELDSLRRQIRKISAREYENLINEYQDKLRGLENK